jgi:hypothetical protein
VYSRPSIGTAIFRLGSLLNSVAVFREIITLADWPV